MIIQDQNTFIGTVMRVLEALLVPVCCLFLGFLMGVYATSSNGPTHDSLQEQIDTQQMKLDLLIEMMKAVPRGEMNWDKL